jgi:hypothetical protein
VSVPSPERFFKEVAIDPPPAPDGGIARPDLPSPDEARRVLEAALADWRGDRDSERYLTLNHAQLREAFQREYEAQVVRFKQNLLNIIKASWVLREAGERSPGLDDMIAEEWQPQSIMYHLEPYVLKLLGRGDEYF